MRYPAKGFCNRALSIAGAAAALLLTLAAPPCLSDTPDAAPRELVLGVFPRRPAIETRQMFDPLAEYLAATLHRPVRLEVPPDFPAFWRAVSDNRFQLVHYNQFHYVRAHQEFGHRVILMNEENGRDRIRSTLWVRTDSGIDLLRQAGLKDTDYLQQFAINPINALQAIYYRQGVAAGLNRRADRQTVLQHKVDFAELRPLLVSPAVAHHPWAVTPDVDASLTREIQQSLLALKQTSHGRKILASAGLTGFSPARDEDYDPHRQIIFRVTGEDYRRH
jgi:phosphonate transport system substrate-binding protein